MVINTSNLITKNLMSKIDFVNYSVYFSNYRSKETVFNFMMLLKIFKPTDTIDIVNRYSLSGFDRLEPILNKVYYYTSNFGDSGNYSVYFKTFVGIIKIRWCYSYFDYPIVRIQTLNNNFKLNSFNDSPAEMIFTRDGYLLSISYHKNELMHRINKPAYILYRDFNKMNVCTKEWWINGLPHNPIGPAKRIRHLDSSKYESEYVINGKYKIIPLFVENLISRERLLECQS